MNILGKNVPDLGREKDVLHQNLAQEDHAMSSHDVGEPSQGLSGLFDMAADIVSDTVELAYEVGNDIAELGHEITDMMDHDLVGDEQFSNQEWADKEWAQLMERRAMTIEQDHDIDL